MIAPSIVPAMPIDIISQELYINHAYIILSLRVAGSVK